jgi:hypothetical protein
MSLNVDNNHASTVPTETISIQGVDVSSPSASESADQINWKKFREERKREREEKEKGDRELAKKAEEVAALKAVVEALASKPHHAGEEVSDVSEEQRIRELVSKEMGEREKASQVERAKKDAEELPYKLAQTYENFNDVCSSENLDYLEYHYPEVASAYAKMPNNFEKWSNIYKAVKRFVPNPDSAPEKRRAEINTNKPQSMSAQGATATGDHAPRVMTDKIRAENWARMQRTMRKVI